MTKIAAATILGLALIQPGHGAASTVLDIEGRRELFIDKFLIEKLETAEKRLHYPVPRERVLTLDKPWEGRYSGYATIIQDDGLFRLYYRGMPEAKHDQDTEVTCYAESRDGLHWIRPNLGLYEVQGTRDNNVVLARHRACHNFSPFLDRNPDSDPAQRFKALGGTGQPGLIALASADGIHWRELQSEPVLTKGAFDSQNISFWSTSEQCYVCYFRVFRKGMRWISRATSSDFIHWSDPVEMGLDNKPAQHLYTNQTQPYARAPHIYVGTPTRFLPGRRVLSEEQTKTLGTSTAFDFRNDCTDIQLTVTRGGSDYRRPFMEAFIRPGPDPRNWTSRANYAVYGIVQTSPEELSLYVQHHVGYPSSHIRRYTLRPDGFVSVYGPYAGGTMTTKPLRFQGTKLTLNMATSAAGGLRVAILDEKAKPIPGYTLDDCPEIIGDDLQRTVAWKKGSELSSLAGQPIRLHFELKDADLYSLQFQ